MFKYSDTWSFDIDGTLTKYPEEWLEYVFKKTGKSFKSTNYAKNILGDDYEKLKHSYRISDDKYEIKIDKYVRDFINKIKSANGIVIIATSRPFDKYKNMREKTMNWLNKNNIKFDSLIKKKDLFNIHYDLHVDDDLSQILQLIKIKDANYIFLNHKHKKFRNSRPNNIFLVKSLREINAK